MTGQHDDELLSGSLDELMAVSTGSVATREVARAGGRRYVDSLIEEGVLIDAAEADRRGAGRRRPDALVAFRHRGEVYYLACVLGLPAGSVRRINTALGSADNAARVLWWTRRHGALSATTIPDAIRAGRVARCVELAQAHAEEHGDARAKPKGMTSSFHLLAGMPDDFVPDGRSDLPPQKR